MGRDLIGAVGKHGMQPRRRKRSEQGRLGGDRRGDNIEDARKHRLDARAVRRKRGIVFAVPGDTQGQAHVRRRRRGGVGQLCTHRADASSALRKKMSIIVSP